MYTLTQGTIKVGIMIIEVWWDGFTDGCDVRLYRPLHITVGIMIMEVWWDGFTHGCDVPLYRPLHITVRIMIMEVWWDGFTHGCEVPLYLPLHITVRIMIMEVWMGWFYSWLWCSIISFIMYIYCSSTADGTRWQDFERYLTKLETMIPGKTFVFRWLLY